MRALRKRRAATTLRAPTRCSGPGGCSDCAWASATAAARLALGGAAGAALQRLRQPGWGCSEGAWGCSDCGSEAGASTCQRRCLVASSPRRYPSPPRSSPVSSPVVAAPSSRRVIPPRLYPQRQPVRAPCKSSLCGRRVVAAARKTIFWKCHYEFTCHVFHPKSTVLYTPPFTALVAAWISGSRDCIGIDCRPARRIRCRGRGPRTPATPWHAWQSAPIPAPLPSPHKKAQPAIGVRVGVKRMGVRIEMRIEVENCRDGSSEGRVRIGVRIGVRIEGGSE